MEITRNDDGSLEVPVEPTRAEVEAAEAAGDAPPPTETMTLHPGEGGYDEALAELTMEEGTALSTASGREQAMSVVHAVTEEDTPVAEAVDGVDAEPVAEALKHVLVGGQPSVDAFAHEVAEAEGGDPVPAHQVSKAIDEVLQEIED
ncbi:hypothetical protein B7486_57105 [cyanobacterium TDX16]|nr:hypothetical protein B7486_57105 [cyanobacterium TDX16]